MSCRPYVVRKHTVIAASFHWLDSWFFFFDSIVPFFRRRYHSTITSLSNDKRQQNMHWLCQEHAKTSRRSVTVASYRSLCSCLRTSHGMYERTRRTDCPLCSTMARFSTLSWAGKRVESECLTNNDCTHTALCAWDACWVVSKATACEWQWSAHIESTRKKESRTSH